MWGGRERGRVGDRGREGERDGGLEVGRKGGRSGRVKLGRRKEGVGGEGSRWGGRE